MNLEIFSHSKYKSGGTDGDDVVLHIPDRVYAVFDGATDAHNTLFSGVSVGRVAALTVAAQIAKLVCNDELNAQTPIALILNKLTSALQNKFNHNEISSLPSTTAAMVLEFFDGYRLIVIGDSSIRINGSTIYSKKKKIDEVSTFVRIWVFKHLTQKLNLKFDEIETLVRRVSFLGLDLAIEESILTKDDAKQVINSASDYVGLAGNENEVANFLNVGIQGQHIYANNSKSVLGYGCLNSTELSPQDVIDIYLAKSDVRMLEIYSDGYLSEPKNSNNIADWEKEYKLVEKLDFHKLDCELACKSDPLRWVIGV